MTPTRVVPVLHLITRLPVGGAEKLLVDIVGALPRQAFAPIVCCIQDGGELAREIEAQGVPLVCLGRMRSRRFDWRAVRDLVALIRREGVALVHSHLYHANLYGRLAARIAGVPAIATVHNTYTRTKLHRRLLNRYLGRHSARVIAVSDEIRDDVLRHDGLEAGKVTVVRNGIDARRLESGLDTAAAKARLGLAAESVVVGCVARLEEQKGHRFLLQAIASLASERPHLRLALVGDGRLRGGLEALARELGIAERVLFLGTRHDVADVLRAMDVFAMASLWEGLSIAMLEAMAAGLPLVVTDVGGVRQVLGDTDECGVRVAAGDVPELARALSGLIDDAPRRSALGANARRRVLDHFTAEGMIRRLQDIYREALTP